MPFQTQVNLYPAPAQAGDFASADPRASVLAGPGAFTAGSAGVTPGLFGWVTYGTPDTYGIATGTVLNTGSGVPTGFIHRSLGEAMITTYLAESGSVIQPGFPLTLFREGDFWAVTTTTATVGQKVFAVLASGAIATGAAGGTVSGAIETKWYVGGIYTGAVGELIKITTWPVG
jgi:hypothetical protein